MYNVKEIYYNSTNDVAVNKHHTINTNGKHHVTKINKLVKFDDNSYFTTKIEHKSNTTNNTTRHSHNNYEHSVSKKVHRHIKRITNYDTEINCYSKNRNCYC